LVLIACGHNIRRACGSSMHAVVELTCAISFAVTIQFNRE
jgi:hypothetical protein